jgi:hypothetical protein
MLSMTIREANQGGCLVLISGYKGRSGAKQLRRRGYLKVSDCLYADMNRKDGVRCCLVKYFGLEVLKRQSPNRISV